MVRVSGSSSGQSNTFMLSTFTGIAAFGLGVLFLRHVYNRRDREPPRIPDGSQTGKSELLKSNSTEDPQGGILLRKKLQDEKGYAFVPLNNTSITPEDLSYIRKIEIPLNRFIKRDPSKPFEDSRLPDRFNKIIQKSESDAKKSFGVSSINTNVTVTESSEESWHTDTPISRINEGEEYDKIRSICTLRGPRTKFANLDRKSRIDCLRLVDWLGPETQNTYSPKPGQHVVFYFSDPYGTIHTSPNHNSRGSKDLTEHRIFVIHDADVFGSGKSD